MRMVLPSLRALQPLNTFRFNRDVPRNSSLKTKVGAVMAQAPEATP
jgi:hypothetical protein